MPPNPFIDPLPKLPVMPIWQSVILWFSLYHDRKEDRRAVLSNLGRPAVTPGCEITYEAIAKRLQINR
jgi:hypothetical protein